MPTVDEVLKDIHEDKNAISAAAKGLEAAYAFALEASNSLKIEAKDDAQKALDSLVYLIDKLKAAVPANVVPASAGPVGKSPHEQYLEQAADVVHKSLAHAQSMIEPLQDTLNRVTVAVNSISTALAAVKSPDLKK